MGGGAVAERRLRPLWDAIESRQFKSALKLASALQSKHPDSPYVLALKGLVLERLGKPDAALVLCRQAKELQPADVLTLSAIEIVLQRLGFPDEAAQAYESALLKNPGNLEVLMPLFNLYVRQQSYVKQQQTAMKTYKITGDDKYLIWAVCSIYAQVRSPKVAGDKLLTLAEALLKKKINAKGMNDFEALRLYISILQDQNKHEDALSVVSGSLGSLFTIPAERLKLQGELLMHLQRFSEASAIYKEILRTSSDDWNAFTQLLNASLGLSITNPMEEITSQMSALTISREETHIRLDKVTDFMRILQASDTQELRRGPFLAMVEIEYRRFLHESKDSSVFSRTLAESILEYFERFGHLASFFVDVKAYLLALDKSSQEWILGEFPQVLSRLQDSADPIKLLRRQIAVFQVEEFIGQHSEGLEVAKKLVSLYLENLKYSADLAPEESIIGEELLVMAVNLLLKARLTMEAVCILEFGLSLRRFNFQFKLLLVSLYFNIFAVNLAIDWFKALDIKNILFELASHHVLPALIVSPNWPELETQLKNSVKFHEDYQLDAGDMTISAYKHGNYLGTFQFVELKERLENSHHFLLSRTELAILSLKQDFEKLDVIEGTLVKLDDGKEVLRWCTDSKLANLKFNEDFETRPWWSRVPGENLLIGSSPLSGRLFSRKDSDTQEHLAEYQDRSRKSIKRRSSIPRLLFLAFSSVSVEKDGHDDSRRDELKQLLDCYLKSLNFSLNSMNELIDFTENENMKEDPDILSGLVFYLALQLSSWSSSSSADEITDSMSLLGDVLTTSVGSLLDSSSSELGSTAPLLVKLISEPVSWLALCVQAWLKRLLPLPKRKKKPNEIAEERKVMKIVESLRNLVARASSGLEAVNAWVVREMERPEEADVERLLSAMRSGPSGVIELLEGTDSSQQQRWEAGDLVRRIVSSQRSGLLGLGQICGVRLRVLKSIK